jgi:hypothetical protein
LLPDTPPRLLGSALRIAGAFPVLAQADFKEDEQHNRAKPNRDQGHGERPAGRSPDYRTAQATDDDECGGRAKRNDSLASGHLT